MTDEIIDRVLNNLKKINDLISLLDEFAEEIRRLEEITDIDDSNFPNKIMPDIRNENIVVLPFWRFNIEGVDIYIPKTIWALLHNIMHMDEIKEKISKLVPSPEKEFLEFLVSLHPQP